MSDITIAWNRFGLGARAGERPPPDLRGWLLDQLDRFDPRPAPIAALPGTAESVAGLTEFLSNRRRARQMGDEDPADKPNDVQRQDLRGMLLGSVTARGLVAVRTDAPFPERLVHFWANHFTVSIAKRQTTALVGPHEFEAIRPNIMGNFRHLLRAAVLHPAMLAYLDQSNSTGPSSQLAQRAGRRNRELGLNENLAREIMELHTLGVNGGYSQEDVTEFARAMTGWTMQGLPRARRAEPIGDGLAWSEFQHEPGTRTVLGRSYAQAGPEQSLAMLDAFAAHPSTARHVATKLARHFAADDPPPEMVARLERAFLDSDGDLPTIYRAMVDSPEAWDGSRPKFRTPWDWTIASFRALGLDDFEPRLLHGTLRELGQPCWAATSPKGYDDIAASWAAPDALIRRVEAAETLAKQAGDIDALALAQALFPRALNDSTATAIRGADNRQQAAALLLASPEMMRR
ncbi:DUF1800 domain-containing protein [Paraurantiacibacter namhicola]|uniref:DUF1800 domain-containing protein n=1 Tax=Paraurantiacibacter namhicola TaxID=645517 RepID=A0A1C7DA47_9SPHN|nr:DUF1800 domain-containing protein [Paraurantiacibacter namhicola]ANU08307.1 hypothetical protein A6F65_02020 [Paraurantiacibacter namhicola]